MYVSATPVQPAPALAPVGVVSAAPVSITTPLATSLKVRSEHLNVLENRSASITGTLLEGHRPGRPGRVVTLQTLVRHGWKTLALAHTATRGRFRLTFTPRRLGSRFLRLHFQGDATARSSHRRLGRLNVYRLAVASWYGGGGGMACGGQLTSSTLGVANKTLPCGTLVTLRYGGHTIRVPVVDRGPYVAGREFDLTEATKRALGFGGVGQVWSTD
ncbi:MAG: septal ring lytic transglycosylase RlpA family protein [Solirubrobacteraceae bacterium]